MRHPGGAGLMGCEVDAGPRGLAELLGHTLQCEAMCDRIAIHCMSMVRPELLFGDGVDVPGNVRARIAVAITTFYGTQMAKQKSANSPATMTDVFNGTEAALGFAGAVMARVLPLFVRYPLVSTENFEALQKELEALATEYERTSPYSVVILDSLLHTLEVDRDRIFIEPGKAA